MDIVPRLGALVAVDVLTFAHVRVSGADNKRNEGHDCPFPQLLAAHCYDIFSLDQAADCSVSWGMRDKKCSA